MVKYQYRLQSKVVNMGHLTQAQRPTISVMNEQGYLHKEISEATGKDKSVVRRVLKRNCDQRSGRYNSDLTHRKYLQGQRRTTIS